MKKTTYLLIAMTVLVVLFASACGGTAAPATQPPVESAPTQPPDQPAPTQAPPEPTLPPPTVQNFAPACQSAASCTAPDVKDTEPAETYCVEKIPYQNILVEPGTTFETLDPKGELKCQDSGTVVDGKNVITCTGKELWTYELKFTNPACAGNALATGTGQCQGGLGYDAANNCCAPLVVGDSGSVVIKVNMGACPLPQ